MKLDPWQQQVLQTKGNICLRSGRQVGKSTVIAIKAGEFAINNPNTSTLVIACVERQALLLFEKILSYLYDNHRKLIKKGKDKPTKHQIKLTNGSIIRCLPTGLSGYGIRGYTTDLLIADEAAFIPEEVWQAVTPQLATRQKSGKGHIILLSTPFGKGGYFYRCFEDDTFTGFHVSSEDCPRISKEFLEQEKKRMGKLQYAQEYLGEFVDDLRRFFSPDLIKKCMEGHYFPEQGQKYLGIDIARMGRDDSVLYSLILDDNVLYEHDLKILSKHRLTEVTENILIMERQNKFKRIYIDDGGLGVGVFDSLLDHPETRRKIIPINNSSRGLDIDKESGKVKKLLKEDLYNNLLVLMEQGRLKLKQNPETVLSLKSVQAEYTDGGKLKIFGNYTHIVEALIRAAWCVREKSLNIYIH